MLSSLNGNTNILNVELGEKTVVKCKGLHLPNYKHQITMRVVDYLQIQIKEVLL